MSTAVKRLLLTKSRRGAPGSRGCPAAGAAPTRTRRSRPPLPDLPRRFCQLLDPCPADFRFGSVALVSKRLAALCLVPELVHCIDVDFPGGDKQLPRLEAFLEFLATHARHICSLQFGIGGSKEEAPQLDALVMGCLGAIGAAGALESLSFNMWTPLGSTAWLPGLTKLRQLTLRLLCELRLPAGLSKLTALTDASLLGRVITAPTLPTSLTALSLADCGSPAPPPQVRPPNLLSMPLQPR